ncbi:uncharacterized protein LOC121781685 [Salvia splendens]|uniref:uncharacterized protein LOC121781685 n=1 Tax=Salvia splendens TaxID=180675 RepID=UPI001C2809D5|nr:uncharacterized protein LOC121781685 [Salvia splendens]
MLGSYAQPNNRPLFGWTLVAKATDNSSDILKQPTDYALVWSNGNASIFNPAYFWLPIPPEGYKSLGLVVTTSPGKPSLDKIKCVRSNFTADAEIDDWIWGNVYGLRPKIRGAGAQAVSVGAFSLQSDAVSLSCLINTNPNYTTGKLNGFQMETLFQAYAPYIYFHPKEKYLPSSVEWFFNNGALLYTKGQESNPVGVESKGLNLPTGGSDDGLYWLDLPTEDEAKDRVKSGDLLSAEAYVHFKPVLGGTFTDIQVWMFYPFNGHAIAKLGFIKKRSLGRAGEHVGDWEHVTLRVSNFDGALCKVYFSQHSGGRWVDVTQLQFQSGNRFVWYASRNGHAGNYEAGTFLQGPGNGVGIRNDWEKSDKVVDTGASFVVVATELEAEVVAEPVWLGYERKWGPTKDYDTAAEVRRAKKWLPGELKKALEGLVKLLDELFGMEGPTGPKLKNNWSGDEL